MKRAKDKYMINRTKYKDIKRYDHQQMEDFLTDVYKNGYADGKESVPGVELQDVEKALQDVKGIGPVVWNRIKERLAELFRKEQQERAKKYGCDGRCYWSTGMCPSVEICDETRVGEAIATAIGLITVLAMIAMVPIIVIGGAIMLIWSIFAV